MLNRMQQANRGRDLLEARGFPTHVRKLYPALGLPGGSQHLPDDGLAQRELAGIRIWVIAKSHAQAIARDEARRFVHRVRCFCPLCGEVQPASRLHQHVNSQRCISIAEEKGRTR